MSTKTTILLVNFGGPRNLSEIAPFLVELLTDADVIKTPMPRFFERWFFRRVALKRAPKVAEDYELIGGKSPLFEDTEKVADALRIKTNLPVITFHRYLPATHSSFLDTIQRHATDRFIVLPMYPQFSFSTTGSIAQFFSTHLPQEVTHKMEWVRSYPDHPLYVQAMQNCIRDFLTENHLKEEETFLFFSAHGLPKKFVDPYENECNRSYQAIIKGFPNAKSILAYQSKFGRGEWLKPYTIDLCQNPDGWRGDRKNIVFIPLSFTSDHLETLFEIENLYVQEVRNRGLNALRCPALNHRSDWMEALVSLLNESKTDNRSCHDRRKYLDACYSTPCRDKTARV
jgi:protoporphyrin/coproporphyrin ferrochelatase